MPGRYLTAEEMRQLLLQAAQPAITQYGIKDVDGFIQALMAVAYAESPGPSTSEAMYTWDTQAVHDNGQGFGLFAEHNQGYAGYLTKEQRLDPATNAGAAAMKLGALWRDGDGIEANIERMTGPQGQNPADPQALSRNAMSAWQRVWGAMGGIGEPPATWPREAETAGVGAAVGQGTTQGPSPGQWVEQAGLMPSDYGADWENPMPGERGDYWLSQQTPEYRKWVFDQWLSAMGQTTEAPTARDVAATALDWALVERTYAELGGETYEQGRQRILDQMDQQNWTADQAVKEFNAWMSGALEAGKRAETVYGEQMKRAAWTTPTEHYPGTEPGGRNEQMYERYGLPYTPSPGIPIETLPNPEQMYERWHDKMGISQQAPATQGGWSGQGAGQGTGIDAARAFLQKMGLQSGQRY